METAHPLDGLDSRPWSSLSHAYGSAQDVPDLLRALAGTDVDAADEALSELYGSILHQGTVYAASAEAVPFLARIAAGGHRPADVLVLLGGLARSEDEHGVAPGAVRAAVVDRLPLLLPLLAAPEGKVRRTAAWAVSHTGAPAFVLRALRSRWAEETEPAARAEVLAGIARLDPQVAAVTAATVLESPQPAEVRMAAVFALLDADAPWTGAVHATMLSLLPADSLRSDLDFERGEPLAAVVEALLGRGLRPERDAAFLLVVAALHDDRADVRAEGLWAADRACMLSRSAPQRLVGSLRAAAVDEESVIDVASLLGQLGSIAEGAADVLAPLAGRNPGRDDDAADRALAALVLVAPAQAARLLAAGLGRRPRALDAAAGFRRTTDPAFPYDDELLEAVLDRLSRPGTLSRNEPWQLTNLAAGWGADAAQALPGLCAALPHCPRQAAAAVASVAACCAPGERVRAAAALRAAAGQGVLPAAKALYELDGELAPLLHCLGQELRRDAGQAGHVAATAGGLGPRGAPLVPALREALGGTPRTSTATPALDTDTALAEALWRITGDAVEAVAVLDSVFARAEQNAWSRWPVVRAARTTALLGPAGRPLVTRLEAALGDPVQVPAAVVALAAVAEPAALDRTALAAAVLLSAESGADPAGACDALEALGSSAMTDGHLRRLTALADGDARTVRSGIEDRVISEDEAFRRRARELLTAFSPPAAPSKEEGP
ncbi:hypothetical protein [Streptomyces sp. G1]|uniref:hypothetical protein n=1 Tax=Streptomyces sp. G1 TaxID=361572 RepID=UPI00202F0D38|nr:hypothetical protein [Streptomyces sp. G1]MCM1965809.1 hypothetical protein [Streptomyces sp. G1]